MNSWIKLKNYSFFFLLLPVATALCSTLPDLILIKKAEQLFAEGHFNDAIPVYQQMLYASSHPCQELILHLAKCYLEISQPQDALDLLINAPLSSEWECDRIYLLSHAYRRVDEFQKAIHLLDSLSNHQKRRLARKLILKRV